MKPPHRAPPAGSALAARFQQAVGHHQRGQLAQAEAMYREILESSPRHFDALHFLGIVHLQKGAHAAAVEFIEKAVAANPGNPNEAAALTNLGIALQETGRAEDALARFDRVLAMKPADAQAHYNRGNVLMSLKRHADALANFDRAIALKAGYAEALNNRGNVALALQRPADALASFDRALAARPDYAAAHNNRSTALMALQQPDLALASAGRALALAPDLPEALNNRGNALAALKRYGEASLAFERLIEVAPDTRYAPGNATDCRLRACDWVKLDDARARVTAAVAAGKPAALPFTFLCLSDSPAAQLACARTFVADRFPASPAPLSTGKPYRHERIRVAYLSADFRDHATAYLMAELFELHDASRFETFGVSFGPDIDDFMRQRLRRSFGRFVDVGAQSDLEVAQTLREWEIDIAVDLKGYSANARTGILAHRPAPIAVNYLVYPGTMGADYVDYIIADRAVIPPGSEPYYAEKVVRLPDSYQVNDSQRRIADWAPTRADVGLPPTGFVYCCFNSSYKITPEVYAIWMRLLNRVPQSVLWLLESNAGAADNLRREARAQGIAPERLIFAPPLAVDRHLARQRLADLFLDTLPVNAHTTASDALWAGLPLLTCVGETFAGRVATSLLEAIGLPELIARTRHDYEALAFDLATAPGRLAEIRARLALNRASCPLFDTDRLRRHIESAYFEMWQRYQRGDAPAAFDVKPL